MRNFVFICASLGLSFIFFASAQDDDTLVAPAWGAQLQVNQIETSQYPEITIFASATYGGQPLTGLNKVDFRVREGDIDQPIVRVTTQRDPSTIVLLLDVSGSMKEALPAAQDAAAGFLKTLSPKDRVQVMTFHERVDTIYPFGNNFRAAESAIRKTGPLGDTALYDGIQEALLSMSNTEGRCAVVVLSDGVDDDGKGNQLSKNDLEVPVMRSMVSNIPVFTIGLGKNIDEGVLRTFGYTTGADYLSAPTANELRELYNSLGEQIAGQYAIRYRTRNLGDGSVRQVKLDYVIPSKKPYASPVAVATADNLVGYRNPDLNNQQKSTLAHLSGLPKMMERYDLPPFESLDLSPKAFWPEWLPLYSNVSTIDPAENDGLKDIVSFSTADDAAAVTINFRKSLLEEEWEILDHSSIANVSTIEASKGNESLNIAAVNGKNGALTNVNVEFEGDQLPIFVTENRITQTVPAYGRDVVVSGFGTKLKIIGGCGEMTVTGANNTVDVDSIESLFIPGTKNEVSVSVLGGAEITGSRNLLLWANGAEGGPPEVEVLGRDNEVDQKIPEPILPEP